MFTVTDPDLVDCAVLLLQWPFNYALNRSNVDKFLAPHFSVHAGLEPAVKMLTDLQMKIRELPSNEAAWHTATRLRRTPGVGMPVSTVWDSPNGSPIEQMALSLDTMLYESVCAALHRKNSTTSRACSSQELGILAQCVWLSSHIALCVLGVAQATLDGESIRFEVANPSSQRALRRAWFGVAFDRYTRISDEARLEQWGLDGRLAWTDIPLFFTKQWRLGLPQVEGGGFQGTVHDLLETVLVPSVKLLGTCLTGARVSQPLRRSRAKEMGCAAEFDMIEKFMHTLPISDRIFQPTSKGLALGPLQLVPGLLSIAEHIARQKRGENWHAELGHEMARYLVTRVANTRGVRVVEVALLQHVTTENVPLDVDVFLVDERINRVYAVQCKHLENPFRIGLLDWLERFRRPRKGGRKGLDKAVQQLSELRRLSRDDTKVTRFLMESIGLTSEQIETIRPVVVHNIWNLDFWQTDQGICFYDLHTFCNAIKGRESTMGVIGPGGVTEWGSLRSDVIVDVADPDALLSAYSKDENPLGQAMANFDAVRDVHRSMRVGNVMICAQGLGL